MTFLNELQVASQARTRRFIRSVWLFPILLAVPLVALTALEIHGSSTGIYHEVLHGKTEDPNLLFGRPRLVRSDEWLINTQMTIAQKNNDFERVNENIGHGQDMSLLVDVPYWEWSILFRPHNLAFFVLPFENAFAFRWWAMAYLLIVSCYFLTLKVLPSRRMLAALLGSALFLSPFVQWWYLYSTLGVLYYCLFGGVVVMNILNQGRWRIRMLWGLLLAYIGTSFALILYPPFQIPAALAMGVFVVGHIIQRCREDWGSAVRALAVIGGAGLLAVGVVGVFVMTRLEAVQVITGTVYPGARVVASGGHDLVQVFSSHLTPLLQSDARSEGHVYNRSEASNFIFLAPFLLVPSVFLLLRQRRLHEKVDYPLLLVSGAILLLLARMFIPVLDGFYALLLLDKVPHKRLVIGLGLLGVLQMVVLARRCADVRGVSGNRVALSASSFAFIVLLAAGFATKTRYPMFVEGNLEVIVAALAGAVVVLFLSAGRTVAGVSLLAALSLASVFYVNPVYRGSGAIQESGVLEAVFGDTEGDGVWAVHGDIVLENLPLLAGRRSVSGVQAYPQLRLWRGFDDRERFADVYSRYAHVLLGLGDENGFSLVREDVFELVIDPCSATAQGTIDYVLASAPIRDPCMQPVKQVEYPETTFYVYRLISR